MNNIINKFLLAGDKFMPEMHLRRPFTRHKERIKEFKRTVDTRIFIEMNSIKLLFSTILLMQIIKI